MTKITITKRQNDMLTVLKGAYRLTGSIPKVKALQEILGISRPVVYEYLLALTDLGLIEREHRTLTISDHPFDIEVRNNPPGIKKGYKYTGDKRPGKRSKKCVNVTPSHNTGNDNGRIH